jgi:serine/threonine protein kinase
LDVYSYGILLLELLTGRQPTDASFGETWHVATWVKESVFQNGGKMSDSILDPLIFDPTNLVEKNIILDVERIALLCTRKNPIDRPTMKNVANLLKNLSQKMEAMNENEDNEGEGSSSQQNDVGILPIQVLKE